MTTTAAAAAADRDDAPASDMDDVELNDEPAPEIAPSPRITSDQEQYSAPQPGSDRDQEPAPPSRSVSAQIVNGEAPEPPAPSEPVLSMSDIESPPVETRRRRRNIPTPAHYRPFQDLVDRSLNRLIKAVSSRKYKPLRDLCKEALVATASGPAECGTAVEKVVESLRAGCFSGKTAAVDICLDAIHKIIEYGFIGGAAAAGVNEGMFSMDEDDEEMLVDTVELVCGCIETSDENIYLRVVQTLLTAVKSTARGLHHGPLLASVRTTYNIYLNAKSNGVRPTAKASLVQIISLVFAKMEKEAIEAQQTKTSAIPATETTDEGQTIKLTGDTKEANEDEMNEYLTVTQKDAYLLFRALCRLSSKDLPDDGSGSESIPLRSKLLSLELLRGAIHEYGHLFRTEVRFIYLFRQYLIPTLLANCMSSSMQIVDVSLDIFELVVLRQSLRPILKTEISSLFATVIFRFLESPASGFPRRRRALRVLNNICQDAQCLADMFVNYDCDMDSSNIFERIILILSNASQNNTGFMEERYEKELKQSALQAMANAVSSLRKWAGELNTVSDGTTGDTSKVPESSLAVDAEQVTPEGTSDIGGSSTATGFLTGPLPTTGAKYSEATESDTVRFQETLRFKRLVEQGITAFNTKPKHGIAFLIEHKIVEPDQSQVAEFLRRAEGIDATLVGEYLGESDAFNVNVMHAYTDQHDFTGQAFDIAIRNYLSGFRLPGEAQKIDRIMEKFASRFCECNPSVFANADTAYVLAYSVIMLNTDAHNAQVKVKMSKEDFFRNNRGINDGHDVDPELLGGLYDRIVEQEIRLSDSVKDSKQESAVASAASASGQAAGILMNATQRAEAFRDESERLLQQTRHMFGDSARDETAQDYVYFSARNVHHAMLMFETSWAAILAANSVAIERAPPVGDENVPLCLHCFKDSIAISSNFGMDTEKESYLSALAKFAHLERVADMRAKNVACVRTLLEIATYEGNYLGKDWTTIVRAVSQLEQIRAVASGRSDQYFLSEVTLPEINLEGQARDLVAQGGSTTRFVNNISGRLGRETSDLKAPIASEDIDGSAIAVARAVDGTEIERLFMHSSKLEAHAIADLAQALCTVALEELDVKPVARVFCILKIIEISYYNMEARTRIQWTKIWEIFSPFFTKAICHPSTSVAMFCIDSLRQLASKFLEKDELSNYAFQKTFLKPFEIGFSRAKSNVIRELVLTCVSQIVLSRAANIKSGWKPLFVVLSLAAEDRSEAIMNFGFQIVDMVLRKYFSKIDDVFVDAVSGVGAYARNPLSSAVCLAAIDHLAVRSAVLLAEGNAFELAKPNVANQGERNESRYFSDEVDSHVSAWFPVLTGLANAIADPRENVRSAACDGLFSVLSNHGGMFTTGMWRLIFSGVLSPIFDDVHHLPGGHRHSQSDSEKHNSEWVSSTGAGALRRLVTVAIEHFVNVRQLLPEILQLIRTWIVQESEQIARDGMAAVDCLVETGAQIFLPDDWDVVVSAIVALVNDTMPTEIAESPGSAASASNADTPSEAADAEKSQPPSSRQIDFKVVRTKCVMQLLLIQSIQDAVNSSYINLSTDQILAMADALESSFSFAHDFNLNLELRFSLWKAGFMNQVPNLFKQETTGMVAFLRLLFLLYLDKFKDTESTSRVEKRLLGFCEEILRGYVLSNNNLRDKPDEQREMLALVPVVCAILHGFLQMSEDQFSDHLNHFFDLFMELVEVESRDVRMSISDLIRFRIGSRLGVLKKPYEPAIDFPGQINVLTFKVEKMSSSDVVTKILLSVAKVYRVKVEQRKQLVHVYGSATLQTVMAVLGSSRIGSQVTIVSQNTDGVGFDPSASNPQLELDSQETSQEITSSVNGE